MMEYSANCKTMSLVLGIGEVLFDMLPAGKQCGGAPANVVYHLARLGIPAAVVSAVGKDALGDELLSFLQSKGVFTGFITRNDFPTGTVEVSLHDGIPSYNIHRPAAWDAIAVPEALRAELANVSAIIWGTLAQRNEISRNAIETLLTGVPENCLKCFDINLRQNYFDEGIIGRSLQLANVLKINDEEVEVVAKLFRMSGTQEEIIRELFTRYSLRYVICTLGAEGSMLYDGKNFTRYPVKPCKVMDTVGCGDAFLAGWCAAVLRGKSAGQGMAEGTGLAAKVAGQAGAMGE